MPRNLSAWPDSVINLAVMLVLVAVLIHFDRLLGACALLVWALLIFFAYERRKSREKQFKEYSEAVIGNINDMMYYAMTRLPEGILIMDGDGRLQWCNDVMQSFSEVDFQQGMDISEFWDGLISDDILNLLPNGTEPAPEEGDYIISAKRHRDAADDESEEFDRYFWVQYRHLQANPDYPRMVVLFALEITLYEELKVEYQKSRTALIYVQVDNYDEVTQGLNDTEKTALMLSVSAILEDWVAELSGLMRRVANDMFIVILERRYLERAIDEKFTVLDKVRQLVNKKQIQVTLSMGAAFAEKHSTEQTIGELDEQAQAGLDLALGRGGDQVAVRLNDRTQFFGGRAKAVEKNTRVKARVMAKSIRDIMERCDEVFVMGHIREDYDAFGAAVGVALMAKNLGKPVHVVLSSWLDSIEKILKPFRKSEEYADMFIRESDISTSREGGLLDRAKNFLKSLAQSEEDTPVGENKSRETMLVIVDTFIPKLVAVPSLLERVNKIVVIDHHRRSETTIKNTELIYLEPGSSSTCEMVTELLTYFDEKISIGKLAATALYSGMVVDTKNFTVQTGARTFEAAAYLRRSGADPVAVNHLFKSDYDTTVTLAKTKAQSEFYEGGLVISCIDNLVPNVQAIAGQAADSLLLVEGVRMTIILFQMKNGAIGISARSVGDLNVQVIMEKFGGGGHQNVAGAQVKDANIFELRDRVTEVARAYIAESDKPIVRTN